MVFKFLNLLLRIDSYYYNLKIIFGSLLKIKKLKKKLKFKSEIQYFSLDLNFSLLDNLSVIKQYLQVENGI